MKVCAGLAALNEALKFSSPRGPFFLGDEPSLAEAVTAPALFRMAATLRGVRDLDLVLACEELHLNRVAAWISEVLARPQDCCDVVVLPPAEYVHLACRLHVRFVGPPSPGVQRPRAAPRDGPAPPLSLDDCGVSGSTDCGPKDSFIAKHMSTPPGWGGGALGVVLSRDDSCKYPGEGRERGEGGCRACDSDSAEGDRPAIVQVQPAPIAAS